MVKKKTKSSAKSDLDNEIDDWMQTDAQDQNLVPCPRCGHYIMDEDVYDRLCDGVNESTGDYCPNIFHNICLDKEEMALDGGGFWFCPDCKANHFSMLPGTPKCEVISEPSPISVSTKNGGIEVPGINIPTKGTKGSLGAASKAASAKQKRKKKNKRTDLFIAPDAYVEALGGKEGHLPHGQAFQTPRGPVSARGSGPLSTPKGKFFSRGQVTDKVGAGLWKIQTPTSELAEKVQKGHFKDSKTDSFKMWSPNVQEMDAETRDLYNLVEEGIHEGRQQDDSIKKQQQQLERIIAKRDQPLGPLTPLAPIDRRNSKPVADLQAKSGPKEKQEVSEQSRAPANTKEAAKAQPKTDTKSKSKACIIS